MKRPGLYHELLGMKRVSLKEDNTCRLRVLGAIGRCELEGFGHDFWFAGKCIFLGRVNRLKLLRLLSQQRITFP